MDVGRGNAMPPASSFLGKKLSKNLPREKVEEVAVKF